MKRYLSIYLGETLWNWELQREKWRQLLPLLFMVVVIIIIDYEQLVVVVVVSTIPPKRQGKPFQLVAAHHLTVSSYRCQQMESTFLAAFAASLPFIDNNNEQLTSELAQLRCELQVPFVDARHHHHHHHHQWWLLRH